MFLHVPKVTARCLWEQRAVTELQVMARLSSLSVPEAQSQKIRTTVTECLNVFTASLH